MSNKFAIFQLVRWVNQLFVLLTQALVWYCIIKPFYNIAGFEPSLNHVEFFLLVASTMLIAAAGYIINDYFDIDADMVNKPIRVTVGRDISRQSAMVAYAVCNIVGVAIGFYLGWQLGNYKLGFIHIFTAALLWFYSTTFKQRFFIGNLIVASMAALVVFLPALFESNLGAFIGLKITEGLRIVIETLTNYEVVNRGNTELLDDSILQFIVQNVWGYAIFAFLLTLVREIVKDVEDVEGDENEGYQTAPIVLGVNGAKLLAAFFIVVTLMFIFKFQMNQLLFWWEGHQQGLAQWHELFPVFYALLFIEVPLLYVFYKLSQQYTLKVDHAFISALLKIVMLAGILYMVYIRFSIQVVPQIELPPGVEIQDVQIDEGPFENLDSLPDLPIE